MVGGNQVEYFLGDGFVGVDEINGDIIRHYGPSETGSDSRLDSGLSEAKTTSAREVWLWAGSELAYLCWICIDARRGCNEPAIMCRVSSEV